MKTAICAIIKNEKHYLKEWIEHHLALGFDAIYLYEDKGSESHQDIVQVYDNVFLDKIQRLNLNGVNTRQVNLYNYFLEKYRNEIDWCAFIDIDEFIQLENHFSDIKDFLKDYQTFPGVILNWKIYNANGLIEADYSKSVKERFTNAVDVIRLNHNFKTIANLKFESKFLNAHRIEPLTGNLVDTTEKVVDSDEPTSQYLNAWINHYITKSWEEYVEKLKRGNITFGVRNIDTFFHYNTDLKTKEDELVGQIIHLADSFPTAKRKVQVINTVEEQEFIPESLDDIKRKALALLAKFSITRNFELLGNGSASAGEIRLQNAISGFYDSEKNNMYLSEYKRIGLLCKNESKRIESLIDEIDDDSNIDYLKRRVYKLVHSNKFDEII